MPHVVVDSQPPQLTANAVLSSSIHSKPALFLPDKISFLRCGHGVLALSHSKCILLVCLLELIDLQLVVNLAQICGIFANNFNRAYL